MKEKIFSRDFSFATFLSFISSVVFWLIMVRSVDYCLDQYTDDYLIASLGCTLIVVSMLATRMILGSLIDVWGYRRTLRIGYFIIVVSCALYCVQHTLVLYLVARVLHGVGMGLTSNALVPYVTGKLPALRRSEGIGYFSLGAALAGGVGPFIAVLLGLFFSSLTEIFYCCLVTAVLMFVLTFPMGPDNGDGAGPIPEPDPCEEEKSKLSLKSVLEYIFDLDVLKLAATAAFLYVGYSGLSAYIVIFSEELDLTLFSSFYFICYCAVTLISRPTVGRFIDRSGERPIIFYALGAYMVGFLLLAFCQNGIMLLLSGCFCGFGIGVGQFIIQACSVGMAKPGKVALANSTYMICLDIGSGLGPVVLPFIINATNLRVMYFVCALFAVCAFFVYYRARMRGQKTSSKGESSDEQQR